VRQVLSNGALLSAAGLDVPQSVTLLRALYDAGWDVRTDRLLPEEAFEEIVRVDAGHATALRALQSVEAK
jgi:cobalamin biosynthesis Mg chelatase CobN